MTELEGKYRIIRSLGTGASGETFEAEDLRDGTRVALKRLVLANTSDWKKVDLFQREARVLAGLRHPSIPRYRDSFVAETPQGAVLYLAHDFAPGKSLRGWWEDGWRPSEAEIVHVGSFLLEVLSYLHTLHPAVIHRDIKPANVIRSEDGRLFLVDFGAVRDATTDALGGSTVAGTYGYMAPEQFRGQAIPASDVYGVAATLLYLLGGKSPTEYPQEKLEVAFRGHVRVSPFLARWLERGLEPAPEDRFASAAQARAVLCGQLRLGDVRSSKTTGVEPRVKVLAGILGALLVVAAGVVIKDAVSRALAGWSQAIPPEQRSSIPGRKGEPKRLPLRLPGPEVALAPTAFDGRHASYVFSLAISPDDKLVASGSDRVIKVWDASSGKELRSIAAHDAKVLGLQFFADGKRFVSAGGSTLKTWDATTGKELAALDLGGKAPTRLALSPDDRLVYWVGPDRDVHVVDVAKNAEVTTLPAGASLYSLALNHDGTRLALGLRDGGAKILGLPGGKELAAWRPHVKTINDLAFSPDDAYVATAGDDSRVALTAINTNGTTMLDSEYPHADEAWSVAFSPDGKLIGTASKDKTVGFVAVKQQWLVQTEGTNVYNTFGRFTHDGGHFIVSAGGMLDRWPIARRGLQTPFPEPRDDAAGEPTPRDDDHRRFLEIMRMSRLWPAVTVDEIEAKVREAMAANPRSPLVWIASAQLELRYGYKNGNDYDQRHVKLAREHLVKAESLGAKSADWWAMKAWVERAANSVPAAREAIRQAFALERREPSAVLCEARLDENDRRHREIAVSLGELVRSTRRADILAWAYAGLTNAYQGLGDLDAADHAYRAIIGVNPNSAWAHGNYASFLVDVADCDKGMAEAKAALAIMSYGMARSTLGRAHACMGDRYLWERPGGEDLAVAEYEEALGLDAQSAWAYYGRAAVARARAFDAKDRKQLAKSRADLRKAAQLERDPRFVKMALEELDALEKSWTAK